MRLSQYLKNKFPDLSSRQIKRMLEQGACTINGTIESFGSRIINPNKDKIIFKKLKDEKPKKLIIKKSNIVYQDEYILVYNKSAGWSSLPTESKETNHLDELRKSLELKHLEPVHRLDKNTSGLLIFAKKKELVKALSDLFQKKLIKKTYEAIVDGNWKISAKGKIENYLTLDYKKGPLQKWKVARRINAEQKKNRQKFKHALTRFELIDDYNNYAHIALYPETGRTHQLRVQLADIGYPVLGDSIYAKKFFSQKLPKRHLLHAKELRFKHPITHKDLRLIADLPSDFLAFLDQ
jgi:23S rRNA pseudouridine1911/1915/1917 synthase